MKENNDDMYGRNQEGESHSSIEEQSGGQFSLLTLYKQQIVKYEKEIAELKKELRKAREQNGTSGQSDSTGDARQVKEADKRAAMPDRTPAGAWERPKVQQESTNPPHSNKGLHAVYVTIILVLLAFGGMMYIYPGAFVSDKLVADSEEELTPEQLDSIRFAEALETGKSENLPMYHNKLGEYSYTGRVNSDGEPNGKGEAKFPNGDTFVGIFENGELKTGRYTWAEDGEYFEGTFKDGEPSEGHYYDKNDTKL